MENSERLGRQARPGNESGNSRLPVFSLEWRSLWWGQGRTVWTSISYPGFEAGTSGTAAGFPNHCTIWSADHVRRRVLLFSTCIVGHLEYVLEIIHF